MIKFEDTREKIEGLAKIIIQDPEFFPELKKKREILKKQKVLAEDRDFYKTQNRILKKAEAMANNNIWYGFYIVNTINKKEGYMLYKKISRKLIPVDSNFGIEDSGLMNQYSFEEYLKNNKIKNLMTFNPEIKKVCPYFPDKTNSKKDKDSKIKYQVYPLFVSPLNSRFKSFFEKNKITFTRLNSKQELQLNKELSDFIY